MKPKGVDICVSTYHIIAVDEEFRCITERSIVKILKNLFFIAKVGYILYIQIS